MVVCFLKVFHVKWQKDKIPDIKVIWNQMLTKTTSNFETQDEIRKKKEKQMFVMVLSRTKIEAVIVIVVFIFQVEHVFLFL